MTKDHKHLLELQSVITIVKVLAEGHLISEIVVITGGNFEELVADSKVYFDNRYLCWKLSNQ